MAFELDGSVIIDDSRNVVAGAAATFTYLEAATAQITGDYINIDGNLDVAQDIRHLGDSDTKIFFGDNSVTVATAGQNNVGIGTNLTTLTSPSGTDTTVRLQHQGNSGYGNIILDRTANAFIIDNDPTNASSNASYFSVKNKGVENLRINSSGRVAIGTDDPGQANADELTISYNDAGVAAGDQGRCGMTIRSGKNTSDEIQPGYIYFSDGTSGDNESIASITYDHADDDMYFATAGYERLRITSAGQLLLGGTADVTDLTGSSGQRGMVIGKTDVGNAGIAIINSTTGTGRIYFGDATGSSADRHRGFINYYHNDSVNSDYMVLGTAGSEALRIDSDGNVGINSTVPGAPLDVRAVNGTIARFGDITPYDFEGLFIKNDVSNYPAITNGDSNRTIALRAAGSIQMEIDYNNNDTAKYFRVTANATGASGTELFRVQEDGKVGIGTDDPQRKLVVSNSGEEGIEIFPGDAADGVSLNFYNRKTAGYTPITINSLDFRWAPSGGTDAFHIDSSGRTLIGHNANLSEGCLLQVARANDNTVELFGYSANANGARINFTKSRNATIGVNTIVQDGDTIGELHFRAANGDGQYYRVAAIEAEMDGGVGVSSVPGRLIFATTPAGATTQTERMRIGSTGAVSIGGNAAASRFNVIGQNAPQSGSINPGTITDALAMFYGGKRTTIATNNHIDNAIIHIKGQITDNDSNSTGTWTTGQIVFSGRRARGAQAIIENNTVWNYSNQTAGSELSFYTAVASSNGETAAAERLRIDTDGHLTPRGTTGTLNLGTGSNKWNAIYGNILTLSSYASVGSIVASDPGSDYYSWNNRIGSGLAVAGTTYLSGNVGVGTNSPYANASYNSLSVGGSKKGLIEINDDSDVPRAHLYTDGGDFKVSTVGTAGTIRFITGGTLVERLSINSSGQVLVNSTTDPYDSRSLTVGLVPGQSNNYISICAATNGVSGLTFGDALGEAAGNYAGMFEYYHDGDYLTYKQNGSEKLRITSTGQLQAISAADVRLTLGSSGTAGTNDSVHIRADSADLKFMAADGGSTIFETNGTETLNINSDGKVQIDRTVSSTSGDHPALEIETICSGTEDTTFATGIDFKVDGVHKKRLSVTDGTGEGGGDWIFYRDNGTNEALRIASDGNVGINEDTPTAKLHIVEATSIPGLKIKCGTNTNQNTHIVLYNDNDIPLNLGVFGSGATTVGTIAANTAFMSSNSAGGVAINASNASGVIKFGTGSSETERLRIDSSGRVLIGDTSNSASSHADELQVINTSAEGGISIINGTSSTGHIYFGDTDASAQGRIDYGHSGDYMRFYTANDERLRINSSGNVGIQSSDPTALLDVGNTGIATASSVINAQAWEGQVFNVDGNLSSDSIFAVNDISGLPVIDFNATHAQLAFAPYGGNVSIGYTNSGTKLGLKGSTSERVYIVADKLSTSDTVNIDNGNVQYFSTDNDNQSNMTTNITSNNGINNDLAVGDSTTVIIIIKPEATDDKITAITIDGSAATIQWLDGTAPTGGTSGDYDLYSFFILKTADATFTTFGNKVKYT